MTFPDSKYFEFNQTKLCLPKGVLGLAATQTSDREARNISLGQFFGAKSPLGLVETTLNYWE
jgi:hypothetical protein